jgi:hypothetical protein
MAPDIRRLLAVIDSAYDRRSWHGTSLRGSIRGLTARQAAWRPAGTGPQPPHNIWELVVHSAYWKYAALRRLTGARRGSFALEGSNWFDRGSTLDERAWREDIAILDRTHRLLREAVAALSPSDLDRRQAKGAFSTFALLVGVAAHDLYHAGQIQLLKRLQPRPRKQKRVG